MFKPLLENIIPIWYKSTAYLESLTFLKYKNESENILKDAKNTILNTKQLEDWYEKLKFKYFSDKIDLSSLPWVVIHKLGGDCDDFMALSYEILKSKYSECHKVLLYTKTKLGHAIIIVKENDNSFTVMSNMERIKGFKSLDEAAKSIYKDNTKTILYLK